MDETNPPFPVTSLCTTHITEGSYRIDRHTFEGISYRLTKNDTWLTKLRIEQRAMKLSYGFSENS